MFSGGDSSTANTDGVPRPDQKLLGLTPERVATSQEARPLPWLTGRAPMGVTWIANAHDPQATPVTRKVVVGKGETQETTVAYIYEATMIGVLCHGPVDAVYEIWLDEVLKWSGTITRGILPSATITVPNYGTVDLYWGDQGQNVDAIFGPLGHPAYRGCCYVVWKPLIYGRDRNSAPQMEFVLSRKTVVPGWTNPTIEQDVCPIHAAVELAASPRYGGGVRFCDFDKESAEAISAELVDKDLLCSPKLANSAPVEQQLAEILQYAGASFAQRDGQLHTFSLSLAVDFSATPIIESDDLEDIANQRPQHVETAASETRLSYSDRPRRHKETSTIYHDPALEDIAGTRSVDLRRPFITRQSVANKAVWQAGKSNALPQVPGSINVLAPKCWQLLPGTPFRLRANPDSENLVNCRVTSWTQSRPTDQYAQIDYVVDYANAVNGSIGDDFNPPDATSYEPVPLEFERLFELPVTFPGVSDGTWLIHLAARPHKLITGRVVSRATAEAGPYKSVASATAFCAYGELSAELQDTDTTAALSMQLIDKNNFESQTAADADLGDLLAFIGDEIISIETYSPGAGADLTISDLRRGFFGTTAVDHPANREIFIIERSSVVLLGPHTPDSSQFWWKATTSTLIGAQPISTATALNSSQDYALDEDGTKQLDEDGTTQLLES